MLAIISPTNWQQSTISVLIRDQYEYPSPSRIQYIACTLEGLTCTVKTLAADHLRDSFQVVLWKAYFFVQLHRRRVGAPMKGKIFRRVGICSRARHVTYRIVNMTLRHPSV